MAISMCLDIYGDLVKRQSPEGDQVAKTEGSPPAHDPILFWYVLLVQTVA
jgi:hypothetical protein